MSRGLLAATTAVLALAVLPGEAGAAPWLWPVRGPLLARFHAGSDPFAAGQHRGIDVVAAAGTPVVSACAGRVRFAGTAGTSGRTVSVRCGGLVASYLYLRSIAVREGQVVGRSRRLGEVGRSGRPPAGMPQLHFGVRRLTRRWEYVDPLSLLGEDGSPALPPLLPTVPRAPGPLGPAPRPVAPRPRPAPALAWRALPAAAPTAFAWTAWAGLGLLAAGLPSGALVARRRRRRSRLVGAGGSASPGPEAAASDL